MIASPLNNGILPPPSGEILDLGGEDGDAILSQKEQVRIAAVLFDLRADSPDDNIGFLRITEAQDELSHGEEKGEWKVERVSSPGLYLVMLDGRTEVRFECDEIRFHTGLKQLEFFYEGKIIGRFCNPVAWGRVDAIGKGGQP